MTFLFDLWFAAWVWSHSITYCGWLLLLMYVNALRCMVFKQTAWNDICSSVSWLCQGCCELTSANILISCCTLQSLISTPLLATLIYTHFLCYKVWRNLVLSLKHLSALSDDISGLPRRKRNQRQWLCKILGGVHWGALWFRWKCYYPPLEEIISFSPLVSLSLTFGHTERENFPSRDSHLW